MYFTKISLLATYGKLIQLHNKNHVYPSQETLLKLLKQHYRIIINRRSLNYHLADLRAQGLIKSIKRNSRNAQGQFEQLTSATCLTIKGCKLLFKLGSAWALRHLKKLRIKFGWSAPLQPQPEPEPKTPTQYNATLLQDIVTSEEYLKKYPKMRGYAEERIKRKAMKKKPWRPKG